MADAPRALDVKHFVPSLDLATSSAFYQALGWVEHWQGETLAELELAGQRLFLQAFHVREWAENSMLYVTVEDAAAWHAHAHGVVARFPGTRVQPPAPQPHGDLVTYVWDPVGVLLHFAQPG